ncbi:hypothetical protein [Deinococcus koreensis]|uniref:Blue (type 1) copper domain-containing protein n=1 Tax=Deinococcus koreensis TaxID=2054903 RepID=A0A2K3USG7_9DEIO|nr:hypothetical protein [Deinococcus koreensis]PNY79474.1 hypothetical protein CVO96_18750 [Deinococcus koreensis]
MNSTAIQSILRPLLLGTLSAALALGSTSLAHAGHGAAQVEGKDYAFTTLAPMTTGWTTFAFKNTGKELHHFQIARLPDGQTFDAFVADLKARGEAAAAGVEFVGGVGLLLPGASQTATVNLNRPGTYVQLCFVPDAKGVPHLALGMLNAFQVQAAAGDATAGTANAAPRADVQISLEDFGFQMPGSIKAGKQVWQIVNKGPEPHEAMIFRLLPGKTVADALAGLANPAGPQAAMPVGGLQAVNKGRSSYADLNLEAGDYLLLCLIPSAAQGGKPHFALGMARPFAVR